MRRVVMSVVMGLVVIAWSGMARAQQVTADVNASASAQADPNFKWHNGRWWYWQPSQNHWMVHHNNQWVAPNAQGSYMFNGQPLFGSGARYTTGFRGNYNGYYGNGYYNNGLYGNGYYGNGYYGNGYYGNGYYGNGYYGNGYGNGFYNSRGGNVGAAIGGAIGGGRGAGIGAAIGNAID